MIRSVQVSTPCSAHLLDDVVYEAAAVVLLAVQPRVEQRLEAQEIPLGGVKELKVDVHFLVRLPVLVVVGLRLVRRLLGCRLIVRVVVVAAALVLPLAAAFVFPLASPLITSVTYGLLLVIAVAIAAVRFLRPSRLRLRVKLLLLSAT